MKVLNHKTNLVDMYVCLSSQIGALIGFYFNIFFIDICM